MFQEITPFIYHNEYRITDPTEKDFVIGITDGKILLKDQDGIISYPAYGEISEDIRKQRKFIYLFAIDEIRFFLCHELLLSGYELQRIHFLRPAAPKHLAFAGLIAMQLAEWYESHRYCGRCGQELVPDERERMMRCPDCNNMEYPKISPCVIVAVIHGDKILVTKYKGPDRGRYALVAGFAEIGETIEETVHREVFEETGVRVKNLKYYKCQPWPFSESLLFGFFCELDGSDKITIQEEELSMAKWISREELSVVSDDFTLTNEMLCRFLEGGIE